MISTEQEQRAALTLAAAPRSSSSSVPEPVGDGEQLVGLLHVLDLGVGLVVHGLVAPPGVVQKLLLRRLELSDFRHLQDGRSSEMSF